jgi:ubiquinone/menaquinone biosynthesis C-methylase UbiE
VLPDSDSSEMASFPAGQRIELTTGAGPAGWNLAWPHALFHRRFRVRDGEGSLLAMASQVNDQFHELSYRYHHDHWQALAEDQKWQKTIDSWFDETSADHWRHCRMYEAADHLTHAENDRWLTVGDGQYGLDSVRLQRRGVGSVLPTDIADASLRDAKNRGVIDGYRVENAERLSFADGSFDVVFCKEAFHHFPRPFLALYEMLRVSRKAVIMAEPQDPAASPLRRAIYLLRRLAGRQTHLDQYRYEPSGNYVYSISQREIEKACLGVNLPCVAFKGITDFYVRGGEFAPAAFSSPKYLLMRSVILLHSILVKLGLSEHNILMCCIFKEDLPADVRRRFAANGWRIVDLPRNPYAKAMQASSEGCR